MRKAKKIILLPICVFAFLVGYAQNAVQIEIPTIHLTDTISDIYHDTIIEKHERVRKPQKEKRGWNFIPLPVIGFNTDLGLQLGANCSIYDFGDPTYYPNYKQKIFFVGAYYSKGSGIFRLSYDSKYVVKNHRISGEVNYTVEPYADFRGFNGYESPMLKDLNPKFYTFERAQFKAFFTFQGKIREHLNWGVGISYFNYTINTSNTDTSASLFNLYRHYNIIKPEEAAGGNILGLNGSITYDTRDFEPDPNKGIFAEAIVSFAPDVIDRQGHSFAKINLRYRQYIPLYKNKLTFAYHLAYQSSFLGKSPYYIESYIYCIIMNQNYSEGLGGVNTLRGVVRNRAVGDGIAWGNVELRYRFGNVRFLNQNWYFVLNPFFDAGMVVIKYRSEEMKESGSPQVYSGNRERPHFSVGLGLKAVVNSNFVASLEFGKTLNRRDGAYGWAFGLNYIF